MVSLCMKLVILGGGFCGALIARKLDKRKEIEITLIDKKTYFEYTPSIHKVIFDPCYRQKITIPFSYFLKRSRIVESSLLQVTPEFVETEKEKIDFDYLVISTGIEYPIFLEDKKNVFTLKSGIEAVKMSTKVLDADRILIIGGGLIGTEIAGELATKTEDKRVIIVHPHNRLIERNPVKASHYAQNFLEKRGVQIIFGEKVVDHEDGVFITNKGRIIEADVGIWCAGIRCNPFFMKGFPKSVFTDKNALKVNKYLQLKGYSNIFVGGDINNILEEKTARNAEQHAHLIVKNLKLLKKNRSLIAYKPRNGPLLISLGDWTGIMTFRRLGITGLFPGILKWFVEWWVLRQYK
jgi:NADH dehydrogenase FAD-containing subunit